MISLKSLAVAGGLALAAAAPASAITVSIDGKNGSQTVNLAAGTYTVDVSKDAWSAWSTGSQWLNNYYVDPANSGRKRVNDGTRYASVQEAVNAAQAYTFTLNSAQDVSFYIFDFGDASDNRGSLTLDVQAAAVPVPAAGLLLLSGLVAPIALRKRKKA